MIIVSLCCQEYFSIGKLKAQRFNILFDLRVGGGETCIDKNIPLLCCYEITGEVVSAYIVQVAGYPEWLVGSCPFFVGSGFFYYLGG
jgi:hypothetical protein